MNTFPDPWSCQIELVEGCNRRCKFCGINGIWADRAHRKIKYMSLRLLETIASNLASWWGDTSKRIELAMHGEPLLHPEVCDAVAILRDRLPACQLSLATNGRVLLLDKAKGETLVDSLFDAGLNWLCVDTYDGSYNAFKSFFECCSCGGAPLYSFYDKDCPAAYHNHGPKRTGVILIEDLGAMSGTRASRVILNHAGNVSPDTLRQYGVPIKELPLAKTCSRPFRELVIHYDGSVPACCMDWRHELLLGVMKPDGSLRKIWNGGPAFAVRSLLQQHKRLMLPCYLCDYNGGFRLGLLPKVEETGMELGVLQKAYAYWMEWRHPTARQIKFIQPPKRGFLK